MIDQALIERAGKALDELFAAVEADHPGFELIVRSNLDGHIITFEGDDVDITGDRVFANLTGVFRRPGGRHSAFKAYADTTAEAISSAVGRATATGGSA